MHKKLGLRGYEWVLQQIRARRYLYALGDRRYNRPFLSALLLEAAATWPEVLPWKWKPRSILDVGAYHGRVATHLARLYSPDFVGLVEPQPDLAEGLRMLKLAPHQEVFPCALGRHEGTERLNILTSTASSSLLQVAEGCEEKFHRPMDIQKTTGVPVRTLDSVFGECELDELDLLKIDVQGYELEILASGIECLRHTEILVIEVSFFEHYCGQPLFSDIYSHVTRAGFDMRATFGYVYDRRGHPLQCDAVFISRDLSAA